jgi:hypothetical protein
MTTPHLDGSNRYPLNEYHPAVFVLLIVVIFLLLCAFSANAAIVWTGG